MTKKQRAQVVELLRCAADVALVDGFYAAREAVGAGEGSELDRLCFEAEVSVCERYDDWPNDEERGGVLLEAALRVERMEWP